MDGTHEHDHIGRHRTFRPALIVVDLGCADHGKAFSLQTLAARYGPDRIYGFDPSPALDLAVQYVGGVPVTLRREAAWLYDGEIGYMENGWESCVGEGDPVRCFDFPVWLARNGPAVVKMDIEGAEHALLERVVQDGTDLLISELLVEWHRHDFDGELRCPVTDWWL